MGCCSTYLTGLVYEAQQQSSDQVLGDDAREAEEPWQKYRDRKTKEKAAAPPRAAITETARSPWQPSG